MRIGDNLGSCGSLAVLMKADLKRIKLHPDQHENEDEHVKEYLKHD